MPRIHEDEFSNDFTVKKKRSHDVAYLIILLTVLIATFIFAATVVNNLFRSIGVGP